MFLMISFVNFTNLVSIDKHKGDNLHHSGKFSSELSCNSLNVRFSFHLLLNVDTFHLQTSPRNILQPLIGVLFFCSYRKGRHLKA